MDKFVGWLWDECGMWLFLVGAVECVGKVWGFLEILTGFSF